MKLGIRTIILIVALMLAVLAIAPWNYFDSGVVITSIDRNSSAYESGLTTGTVIKQINSQPVENIQDYSRIMTGLFQNNSGMTKVIFQDNKGKEIIFFSSSAPEIGVSQIPKTKIKTGLDLSGGARALVKPVNVSLSAAEINDLISITNERFNQFGLKDITIKSVSDLQGENYMLIEIAGATPSDLRELVGKQGKFEAKIGNETAFIGGKNDIPSVCRTDATCSRIEAPQKLQSGGYGSNFQFTIYLSEEAAKRHAEITSRLDVNITDGGRYLSKKLDLYIDDVLADSLLISEGLKGKVTSEIAVSGSGTGPTELEAYKDAQVNMKKLQIILITGSLPYKLEIVKLDTISPTLGQEFTNNLLILGLIVFAIVSLLIFVKYRKIKITLAVILTMFSEAFIVLGLAAFIGWNLDAPSIAGIIAGIGTGVNDQILLIDESRSNKNLGLKERIKRAFFIIIGAFFTIVAAMLPLMWAGAGLLRGFAFTTILGVSIGILITRPAFGEILKRIVKD